VEPRVIVVTGASAGVGRAVARRFAREGARVALLARGSAGLGGAQRDVEVLGGAAIVVRCDVAVPRQVEAAADRVERELGPIDVWVNAAVVSVEGSVLELDDEELRRVTDVTYLGVVHGTRAALRRMIPRDRGTIVQVGSSLSPVCQARHAATVAARYAVVGFTEAVRAELAGQGSGVWVTLVRLPAVNTPHFDWQRTKGAERSSPPRPILAPEVAAEAIHFAAGCRRREVVAGRPGLLSRFRRPVETAAPARRDNLFLPADDRQDHGARGRFVFGSRATSLQLWATMHRGPLAAAGALLAIAGVAVLRLRESPGRLTTLRLKYLKYHA
jgi:NAD(P)-dependent dehydrogenase (short-subunit alcohol dehydrogenase family)